MPRSRSRGCYRAACLLVCWSGSSALAQSASTSVSCVVKRGNKQHFGCRSHLIHFRLLNGLVCARCWWQRQNLRHLLTVLLSRNWKRERAYRNIGHHTTWVNAKVCAICAARDADYDRNSVIRGPTQLEWLLTTQSRFQLGITPVGGAGMRFRGGWGTCLLEEIGRGGPGSSIRGAMSAEADRGVKFLSGPWLLR